MPEQKEHSPSTTVAGLLQDGTEQRRSLGIVDAIDSSGVKVQDPDPEPVACLSIVNEGCCV